MFIRAGLVVGILSTVVMSHERSSRLRWTLTPGTTAVRCHGMHTSGLVGVHTRSISYSLAAHVCDATAPGPAARTAAINRPRHVTGVDAMRYTPRWTRTISSAASNAPRVRRLTSCASACNVEKWPCWSVASVCNAAREVAAIGAVDRVHAPRRARIRALWKTPDSSGDGG